MATLDTVLERKEVVALRQYCRLEPHEAIVVWCGGVDKNRGTQLGYSCLGTAASKKACESL
jgi:hypothetical protein